MSYFWLSHDPDALGILENVSFDKAATRTRAEEFRLARDKAKAWNGYRALDAATGYVPNWHVFPYILAALSYTVNTIDNDIRTMDMPHNSRVTRKVGDIANLPYLSRAFDFVSCISVLEHCGRDTQTGFAKEAARVITDGGLLVVTADNYPGMDPSALANLFKEDFDIGEYNGDETERFPNGKRVAALVAQRKH